MAVVTPPTPRLGAAKLMQHAARATALLEPGRRRLEGVVAAAGLPLPRGGLSLMHLLGAVVAVVAAAEVYLSS